MNNRSTPTRIQKQIVLLGAGNANLVFIRKWLMRPVPGVQVTLVNPARRIPYSAMVPAFLAGEYSEDEVMIDLVRLCALANVRLIAAKAERIDVDARIVELPGRPALRWDILAVGVGSIPKPLGQSDTMTIPLRPLNEMIAKVDELGQRAKLESRPLKLNIVGGGASGCELAIAIKRRLGDDVTIQLIHAGKRLVPGLPQRTSRYFMEQFRERGIASQLESRIVDADATGLHLENGERLAGDATLWAIQGDAVELLARSNLSTDANGFIRVNAFLQSCDDADVFASGDCAHHENHPTLSRNGVHAVKQGRVLYDNIMAMLKERPLRAFVPQSHCLYLLNSGDGDAIFNYGGTSWKSRLARRLKDHIDRRWMRKMSPEPMSEPESSDTEVSMQCGGCGSKVSSDVLSNVLGQLKIATAANIVLGTRDGEDAAAVRLSDGTLQVQTIDYFKSFTDDPFFFGQVAALNALSDLFAMNAQPQTAMAMATLPYARGPIQEAMLLEMLSGAETIFRQHDCCPNWRPHRRGARAWFRFQRHRRRRRGNALPQECVTTRRRTHFDEATRQWSLARRLDARPLPSGMVRGTRR